ncbi:MAG: hypothetical protein Q8L68_04525 [Methylococcales bacterium]|nr:hypothetical protein [Methylococcales bacterium]
MSWEQIVLIGLGILLLVAGGYIKKLIKEVHELATAFMLLIASFKQAIEDEEITRPEIKELTEKWELVTKEAIDVKEIILELAKLIARK